MFDFDNFREIFSTLKKNKLRTFLTGFSVAWGIFLLIILLAAGNGLRNGIMHNFESFAANQVNMWPRYTSKPYKGMQTNRRIQFKDEDYEILDQLNPEIKWKTGIIYQSDTLSYREEYNTFSLQGVHPQKANIDNIKMIKGNGRFINDIDILKKRKVIVLSPRMKEVLFRSENPLGKYINAGQLTYQVIGVYQDENNSNDAPAYIPFSTAQTLYRNGFGVDQIRFIVDNIHSLAEFDTFEKRLREQMGKRHKFDPNDLRAIGIWNTVEDLLMVEGLLKGITLFIWIIGIGTLTAGIVGVSNIMLITVRERTKELGIRKAIGATPFSILKLIIIESILITAVFGYIGMVFGIGITEGINSLMEAANNQMSSDDMSVFRNPTVSLSIAMIATGLIVFAGVIAGYFPARKAVKVTAIEAMRTE